MLRKIIGLAAPARFGKDTVASILLKHNNVVAYALADPLKIGCQTLFGLTDEETWNDSIKENIIPLWGRSPREFFQRIGTNWMRAHNPDHWLMRAERAINSPIKKNNHSITLQLQDSRAPFKLATQSFFDLSDKQTWDSYYSNMIDEFWGMSPKQMFDLVESLSIKDFPDYFERRAQRPITQPTREIPSLSESDIIIIKDIRFENEADFLRRHNGTIWHIIRNDAQKVNAHPSELGIEAREQDVVINNNGTLEQLVIAVEKEWRNHTNNHIVSNV
jgi:hypothetical protein